MGRVDGKVAIVTGGASGIGKACSLRLAAEGATVVLADLNEEDGAKAATEAGETAHFVRHDVTDEASWQALIADTESRFGRLDVLLNNAGILVIGTIESTSLDDFNKVFAVNAAGPFLGCKHAIPAMARGGGGSIINISSVAALEGTPQYAAYSASKGAVYSLSRTVAAHCRNKKNGIRCNSIHPGGISTPMVWKLAATMGAGDAEENQQAPSGAMSLGEPSDIASMVLYLASDEARLVNGSALVIDEGLIA